MLTIDATLAIFLMLGISSLAVLWARRLQIPHTVLLVIIGIGLGFLSFVPTFSFLHEFKLTPELLFYLLLPTLIFESAYQMDIRKLVANSGIVLSLAIGSFLVSAAAIAAALYFSLPFLGIEIPFAIALLFGALISATDPVAVLALFKEYGVPRRLSLIFEGESLFNDATAVAVFLIVLEVIHQGGFSTLTSIAGFLTLVSMLFCGVVFGLLVGGAFAKLLGTARESELASITLTVVLAHITFITAEIISITPIIGDITIPISPIISTTVASLLIGNYGRAKINHKARRFVREIWEQLAFMANSLIFILIGLLIIETPLLEPVVLSATLVAVVIVAVARALSIYPVVATYNFFAGAAQHIPSSWQHLMAWGSLRGALAVTMVFLVPDTLSVPGWSLAASPKEFLLSLTVGCIAATLFVKALTIKSLVTHFKLDQLTNIEEVEYQEAKALMHHQVTGQLKKYTERGYISEDIAKTLLNEHNSAFRHACQRVTELSHEHRDDLTARVLRIFAIGIEKRHLQHLYEHQEVSEAVFRRIWGKLHIQLEAIEHGNLSPDVTLDADSRDVFEYLASQIRLIKKPGPDTEYADRYMYYRAQAIVSRKVLKEFRVLERASSTIFTEEAVAHVTSLYDGFRVNAEWKFRELKKERPELARKLAQHMAEHGVHTIEQRVLNDIYAKELITQKLYIALAEEVAHEETAKQR